MWTMTPGAISYLNAERIRAKTKGDATYFLQCKEMYLAKL